MRGFVRDWRRVHDLSVLGGWGLPGLKLRPSTVVSHPCGKDKDARPRGFPDGAPDDKERASGAKAHVHIAATCGTAKAVPFQGDEEYPSGAKARIDSAGFMRGLKPPPSTPASLRIEFFRSLGSPGLRVPLTSIKDYR